MANTTRRTFIKMGATAASAGALGRASAFAATQKTGVTPRLEQFNYADVQLLDGPMLEQFKSNHQLFLNLDEDSMLQPFRQSAGLPAPGEELGGWYSYNKDFDPPKNMLGFVPGHSFGQWVSALSRAYAVTGDKPTQAKVQRLVAGYAQAITPKFFADYNLPGYTFDKINCGLIDAHQFAQEPMAFAVLDKATDAALPALPPKALSRPEMRARPHKNESYTWDETYTLPENFYLAWQRGAGNRYRLLAERFLQDDTYFNPLSENKNVLTGEHAYSHINALSSAMQAYVSDGSEKHLRAARNGFAMVQAQSFATGGWGPNESFRAPGSGEIGESLTSTHASFETPCGAYGHFKITRYLLRVTGESRYGDSMEQVLYNTVLGASPLKPDGTSFYYADYNDDATKVYYQTKWPCCSGTFPQITADYGISSYFRSPRGLYVNLYVPSTVTWKQNGARCTVTQKTQYPATPETSLQVAIDRPEQFTIYLRIPGWAGGNTSVTVNGKPFSTALEAGNWAAINRTWQQGDRIELSLDMPLQLVPVDPQHPDMLALVHGPVALFAVDPKSVKLTRTQMLGARQRSTGSAEWEIATDQGALVLIPFTAITDQRYRLYLAT
jgi:uncharacterized protein